MLILPTACTFEKRETEILTKNYIFAPEKAININTATIEELKSLPNIGEKTAQEIISYREKFGKFRKSEHLLLVRGISDARFREIKDFIKAE